jgi:hypothetical protein
MLTTSSPVRVPYHNALLACAATVLSLNHNLLLLEHSDCAGTQLLPVDQSAQPDEGSAVHAPLTLLNTILALPPANTNGDT